MEAAESISAAGQVPARGQPRRRSWRDRFARDVRRAWRRTRVRRAIVSLILTMGAIWAGYRASMYVANREAPTPEEVGVIGRDK
jgi:hypothetical protein